MWLPLDLGLLLYTTGHFLLTAVPKLRKRAHRTPIEPNYQVLADNELSEPQRAYLIPFDRELGNLGYRPVLTFTTVHNNGRTQGLSRDYVNDSDAASCKVIVAESSAKGPYGVHVRHVAVVNFITRFSGGRRFYTSNSSQVRMFNPIPGVTSQRLRNIDNIAELKRRHDNWISHDEVPLAPLSTPEAFLSDARQQHVAFVQHQLATGMFCEDRETHTAVTTDKVHWRAVLRRYNLFTYPMTGMTVFGFVLPPLIALFTSLRADDLIRFMPFWLKLFPPAVAARSIVSGGIAIAGFIEGWSLPRHVTPCDFALLYLPLVFWGKTAPFPVVVFFSAAIVSTYAGQIRSRRKIILLNQSAHVS